ncbi:MAG: hypothetical protein RLZZ487_2419 [Pseudomonadota bacterium]
MGLRRFDNLFHDALCATCFQQFERGTFLFFHFFCLVRKIGGASHPCIFAVCHGLVETGMNGARLDERDVNVFLELAAESANLLML